jgi:transcriptional regulator with AAA-type ATPase domain
MGTQAKPDSNVLSQGTGGLRLLVAEGERAFLFELPADRPVWVGRGREADLRLSEPSMAPLHLSLRPLEGGLLEVRSLGGGTCLNDVQLPGESVARPGDQISLGEVRLLVQRVSPPPLSRPVVHPHGVFEGRLVEELERARRQSRPLALVLIKTPLARASGRYAVAELVASRLELPCAFGQLGPEELEVLVPELSAAHCAELLDKLLAGLGHKPLWLGHALAPRDGGDAHLLMARALEQLPGEPRLERRASDEPLFLDPVMVRLGELIDRLGATDAPVLLQGEPGVGKEMLAGLLHLRGVRTHGPFLKLDLAGAGLEQPGMLAGAVGGTLFVPELARLGAGAQAQLARLLARDSALPAMRVIAATTLGDVQAQAQQGALRGDVAKALSQVVLPVPALRDRPTEVLPLAEAFLSYWRLRMGRPQVQLGAEARRVLYGYRWPGNLRELKNAMARAALAVEGEEVRGEALPPAAREEQARQSLGVPNGVDLRTSLKETEREVLLKALGRTQWNVTEAARQLGLPRRTVVYRMSRLGLRRPPR